MVSQKSAAAHCSPNLKLNPVARRDRLHDLMARYNLTASVVGYLVGRTTEQVRAWRAGRSDIPESSLRLLELELGTLTPRGAIAAKKAASDIA